jgi:cystathionine beta-lyase/cystathionine gamma-synthase
LLLRGLRTLPARLDRISVTTRKLVEFLIQERKIEHVIFPLDENFDQYALAREQMTGACGLITFTLKDGNMEKITRFCESLQHILMAVSWGGYESLIIPKAAGLDPAEFDAGNIVHQYIRLYCGLEDADYIISDLKHALAKI